MLYLALESIYLLPKIDPKRAIPRQEHQRATKLFIGGLAGSVTSESMRDFFSQFGKVIDSTVMLDRETGRSKGFGFVSFEDTNVQPFLGFGNLEIDGKLVCDEHAISIIKIHSFTHFI
jgi:RNA-binding protein Musashi